MDASRWQDPRWVQSAHEWIDERLARLGVRRAGEITQPHVRPWATVLRVPTDVGAVWFKANEDQLRQEAAVVGLLSTRWPDLVPPLIAVDPGRGWMLMSDAGRPLREVVAAERSFDRWLEVLPRYAALQLALAGDVHELLRLGVPDLRLATLPDRYAALLEEVGAEPRFYAAVPRVGELCSELAAYGIDETLQHDDLHDGQVFVRDGHQVVLDWADACVSHPFFTLAVTLEGQLAWGLDDVEDSLDTGPFRDAYLGPYAERHDVDLAAACTVALRLGWVCRAVNGHVAGDEQATEARLRMFLDGRPEGVTALRPASPPAR